MSQLDSNVRAAVNKTKEYYKEFIKEIKSSDQDEARRYLTSQTEELKAEYAELVKRMKGSDEQREQLALQQILPKAYGLVKAASEYLLGESPYDVQIIGGIALNDGYVAEMGTGEGKTLTATMPAYLNALTGKQVHIVTPNPYLAKRDYQKMKPLYELLGLKCGHTEEGQRSPRVIADKKRAYERDIVYGSSSAFAFDYLYDGLENNPQNMVRPADRSTFAIVDEADAVLFDDALVPFIISGTQKDNRISMTEKEKLAQSKEMHHAIRATQRFYPYIRELDHQEYSRMTDARGQDDFEEADKEVALILDANTKEYTITTLGYAMLFCYYKKAEVSALLKKHGLTNLDEMQVYDIIVNDKNQELTDLFNKFSGNELLQQFDSISKATTAWYSLKNGVDYSTVEGRNGTFSLSPVTNGRIVDKRKYTNGLQQAIEEKEKILHPGKTLTETKLSDTLASIPTVTFFKKYGKLAGMTGTSIREPLKDMYGLYTYEVPSNKPKNVINHGERFYATEKEKFEAIFKDALETRRKGQPILITTTSITKSESLARYLRARFSQVGEPINIPILNANVQKLEEEAEIISHAGRAGAVTISTEMAGRGTDIKLGGGEPQYDVVLASVVSYCLRKQEEKVGRRFNQEERLKFISMIKDRPDVRATAAKNLPLAREAEAKRVAELGGLKVIGSGHFKYTRIDNQVKGRCGRQGDQGETIFYTTPSDLREVNVSEEEIAKAEKMLRMSGKDESSVLSYLISKAQQRAEDRQYAGIKTNQELEENIAEYRTVLYDESTSIKREGTYFECMDRYIEEIAKRIVYGSSERQGAIDEKTKLPKAHIDYDKVAECSRKIFGRSIEPSELTECLDVQDLTNYITDQATTQWHNTVEAVGKDIMEPMVKARVDSTLTRVWDSFAGLVETIEDQYVSSSLGMLDTKDQLHTQIESAFDYSFETEVVDLLSCMLNPKYGKKGEYMDHLRNIEISPTEVRITPREAGEKEFSQDYIDESRSMK